MLVLTKPSWGNGTGAFRRGDQRNKTPICEFEKKRGRGFLFNQRKSKGKERKCQGGTKRGWGEAGQYRECQGGPVEKGGPGRLARSGGGGFKRG